jgi:hypothetical protein
LPIQSSCMPNPLWYVSYQSLSRSWYIDLDYGSDRLPDLELGLTAGVTGRQVMLTPPRHLIPPLVFPGVHVNVIVTVGHSMYLTNFMFTWPGTLILTADCSVYLTGHIDFDCGLFCLRDWAHWFWLRIVLFTWLGTLILTTDCSVYLTRYIDFDRGLFCLPDWIHWFWPWTVLFTWLGTLILTTDCSVYLTRYIDFDRGLFCLPDWIHWFWPWTVLFTWLGTLI